MTEPSRVYFCLQEGKHHLVLDNLTQVSHVLASRFAAFLSPKSDVSESQFLSVFPVFSVY